MPETPSFKPLAPPSGRLYRMDGRIKLLLLIAACFTTQYLPAAWLPQWLLLLGCLFIAREMRSAGVLGMLRGGVYFTLFWLAMKAGSDLLGGAGPLQAFLGALPVAEKLLALALIGMGVVGLSPPIETGRAAAWFIRPIFGRNAWKPALVIAHTAWFLPQTLRLAGEVRAAMRARGLRLSWRKTAFLVVGASLRILERKAGDLAVGLASRRVDDYRSWQYRRDRED